MTHQDWDKQRLAFRQLVARHINSGTCYLCKQMIAQGEPRHGVTGAHWECANAMPHPAVEQGQVGVGLARVPGGTLVHVVDRRSGASRCGCALSHEAQPRRASWEWCEQAAARYELCPQCAALSEDIPARGMDAGALDGEP
jgi:hypothetical protein